jgi:hypothetical protein
VALDVGVCPVLPDEVAVCASQEAPVEMAQIVAGHVLTILGKLRGKAGVRRAMQTGYESFHDGTREKLKRTDARKDVGR